VGLSDIIAAQIYLEAKPDKALRIEDAVNECYEPTFMTHTSSSGFTTVLTSILFRRACGTRED
jgi:hypothetical protein